MAGFGIFRTYQKASMVALAILAMLAFFVLPPLLQYGGQAATVADSPVAKWSGGELREKGLDRAVTMKLVLNRFLAEASMAAGRDPAMNAANTRRLLGWVEEGALRPPAGPVFDLADFRGALDAAFSGKSLGKVVLRVAAN